MEKEELKSQPHVTVLVRVRVSSSRNKIESQKGEHVSNKYVGRTLGGNKHLEYADSAVVQ